MASDSAVRLKSRWMEMPEGFFETLTFGELMMGQKFITLPIPGEFKRAYPIYIKTHQRVHEVAPGLPSGTPYGRAEESDLGLWTEFPDSKPVILVR